LMRTGRHRGRETATERRVVLRVWPGDARVPASGDPV